METKIHEDIIFNTDLKFKDLKSSNTVPYVFGELKSDRYGLEKICLQKTDTIIDIGANVGMFSIYAKKKFGCRIISFEPVPVNFEHFKENIILNNLKLSDFEIYNIAISDKEGETVIGIDMSNTGGSSQFIHSNITSKCKTDTLDKYLDNTCKYLKLDCEGGEYLILPHIIKKINIFKYLGIEYHEYSWIPSMSSMNLKNLVRDNFSGIVF
jgi:FkbM family methyltransferase